MKIHKKTISKLSTSLLIVSLKETLLLSVLAFFIGIFLTLAVI